MKQNTKNVAVVFILVLIQIAVSLYILSYVLISLFAVSFIVGPIDYLFYGALVVFGLVWGGIYTYLLKRFTDVKPRTMLITLFILALVAVPFIYLNHLFISETMSDVTSAVIEQLGGQYEIGGVIFSSPIRMNVFAQAIIYLISFMVVPFLRVWKGT